MTDPATSEDTPRGAPPGWTLAWLLDVLVDYGLLSEDQAREVQVRREQLQARVRRAQRGADTSRVHYEVSPAEIVAAYRAPIDEGILTEDLIMETVAMAVGMPYRKIDPLKLDPRLVTSTLSRPFAQRHVVLPLERRDGRLVVAVDNPFNIELIEQLRVTTGLEIDAVIASKRDILRYIREIYGFRTSVQQAAQDLGSVVDIGNFEQLTRLRSADELEATDEHVVNAVDYILHYAFDQGASDVHIEPKRDHSLVRMRIDGVLHSVYTMPKVVHAAVVNRIKSLSRLDVAEKRRPQDGRIKTVFGDREVELRISTMPVAFGEKIVVRIFDPHILLQDLESLGFFERELELFRSFIERPHGIVLVTGPTGSGKTTTLYSALRTLASPELNVVTIEDPIEMVVEEFNQVAVQPRVGITFSSALRTVLRQDPDVIMVGEIRDRDTADNAVQAALTGHLVLSTLHTNDAASAMTRLRDLGVEPFLIASTVTGVVAQRLVRKVCVRCRRPATLSPDQCRALGIPPDSKPPTVYQGVGCVYCRHTGLRGRTGIFEVLPVNSRIRSLVMNDADASEIAEAARTDGMMTLREAAVRKLALGVTTFEEVVRVTAEH